MQQFCCVTIDGDCGELLGEFFELGKMLDAASLLDSVIGVCDLSSKSFFCSSSILRAVLVITSFLKIVFSFPSGIGDSLSGNL